MNELERRPRDVVTKIKQIFKQAVLRFWSLRVPLIVVCILLAALLCTAQYQDSSRVASAQMTLNYSEASQGLNPNRTRFTTTDLTSDEVLQSTLYNAGLEGQMTVEQLRRAITVEPTDVTNVSSSENYITTSCSISLQLEEPCQHLTAATLLRIFCGSYKDYFMEHYGENQSVFSCTMPDYFDTEPYLRLKSLTLRANQLARTVSETFVQVGVEIVADLAVFVDALAVFGAQHELLLEAVAVRRAVVGVGDVVDRHRFRAVLLADPVGVRKVDSDRRGGVAVAAEHRHGDDLRRDAFHLRLAHGTFHSDLHVRPPILRILLRPPRTQRLDRGLFFGIKIRTYC